MIPASCRTHRQLRRAGFLFSALALMVASLPAPAQELGRLFFTPERREALDRQRQFKVPENLEVPDDPTLTINGVVTRSSGKRTVWINGAAQEDGHADSGLVVAPSRGNPGQVLVQPEDGPTTRVGVGNTVNRNTGEAADLLGGGSIRIQGSRRQ